MITINSRKLTKSILLDCIVFLVLYIIVWLFSLNTLGDAWFKLLILALPFALLYVIRNFIKKTSIFLLLSLSLCLISLLLLVFLGMVVEITVFFLIASLAYSIYARTHKDFVPNKTIAVFLSTVLIIIFYSVTDLENAELFQTRFVYIYLIIICCIIFFNHIDRLDYKLYRYRQSDRALYTNRLIKTNNTMGLVFIGLVLFVGILLLFFLAQLLFQFVIWVIMIITMFFAVLLSPILFFLERIGIGAIEPRDVEELVINGSEIYVEQQGYGRIVVFFGVFLWIPAAIFLILLAIKVIHKIKLALSYKKPIDTQDEVKLEGSFFDDLLDLLPSFMKNRHPIRKAYEKKINSHIKRGTLIIENHDTTEMIAKKIREAEDIGELTAKYELVRYGRES